jgi:uncharacterized PurR-regulated membrane protein YhhQ (DUF165 family)
MELNMTRLFPFVAAMAVIVVASNILVQYPFQHFGFGELLTWGAFTYPFAFLINDLTNRQFGQSAARKVVFAGFVIAVILSVWLVTPRIAIASGIAFLVAQLIDAGVFDRLRGARWWHAPLISSVIGSALDTALFFSIAFAPLFGGIDFAFGMEDGSLGFPASIFGIAMPLYASLAIGDFLVKLLIGLVALIPYAGILKASGVGLKPAA